MTTPGGLARWRAARLLRVLALAYGVAVLAATAWVAARPRHPVTVRSAAFPPVGSRANLAAAGAGGRVRVSSYDAFAGHHPAFLLDGRRTAALLEKWASSGEDREPFVEVLLPAPSDVDEVVLAHAGGVENPVYTMERYTLRCLRGEEELFRQLVEGNTHPLARHAVSCSGVETVRVEFAPGPPRSAQAVARLYEVEVWGRVRR